MAQTVENAEAVVVTAPKEKVVTPVTVKDVENIAKNVVDASVAVPEFQYKRVDVTPILEDDGFVRFDLPHLEPTKDFYLHDKINDKWIWLHHMHSRTTEGAISAMTAVSLSVGGNVGNLVVDSMELGEEDNYINFDTFLDEYSNSFELIYVPNFTHIKASY